MQPGKIDLFVDELIRLANELKYGKDYVKDKARVGKTADLRNAWAIKTPNPADYVHYLNLLRNTGHQLEAVASFNCKVVRAKDSSHLDKSDDSQTSTKKQRKETKGSGSRNPKPTNQAPWSCRPPESEHAKAYKDIAQTLINRHKRWNQPHTVVILITSCANVLLPLRLSPRPSLIVSGPLMRQDTRTKPGSRKQHILRLLYLLLDESRGRDSRSGSANTGSGYGYFGVGKSTPVSSRFKTTDSGSKPRWHEGPRWKMWTVSSSPKEPPSCNQHRL